MIDLHTHLLPGIDDGAQTLDESLEMARDALADGITTAAATPHVRHDFPTSPETMERLVEELRSALAAAGTPLTVLSGGEIALDRLAELSVEELRRFGLGGNPAYLLLEFPYSGWPLDLNRRVVELQSLGIRPVLAHPERNSEVQAAPERLVPLARAGALVQVTAASLDGRLGRTAASTAARLLGLELVHLVSSDAHAPSVRQIGLSQAVAAVGDARLGGWLTTDVPTAIVRGEPLPERPERRKRWSRFRRGA